MKRLFSRFWVWIGSVVMTAILAIRFILELIGYATIADDAEEAHGVLRVLADMALALPWWAIWWPLFISYICACGIALDFSFDLFKRDKNVIRVKGESGKALRACRDFYSSITPYKYKNSGRIKPTSRYAVAGEAQILWKHLLEKKLVAEDLPDLENLAEDIDVIMVYIREQTGRIIPHLKRGDIKSAQVDRIT